VRQAWPKVELRLLSTQPSELSQLQHLTVRIAASLGGLSPSDVRVEFVARRRLPEASFEPPALSSYRAPRSDGLWTAALSATGEQQDGAAVFALDARPPTSGQFATEIRIYPCHELLSHPYELGLMKWL
jgi:starch phosphorylase